MKTPVDAQLRREAVRFELRYSCADCAHFEVRTSTCAEGFPNEVHRDARVETTAVLEFCKSFELV